MGKRIHKGGLLGKNALQRSADKTVRDHFNVAPEKRRLVIEKWFKNKKKPLWKKAMSRRALKLAFQKQKQKANRIKENADDLEERIGLLGLASLGITFNKQAGIAEIEKARETGKTLFKQVDDCIENLKAVKYQPDSEGIKEQIRRLEESRKQLQKTQLALSKKIGQKK